MSRKDKDDPTTADDIGLFRRLMGDTKPLRHQPRATEPAPKTKPRAHFARQERDQVLHESMAAEIDESEAQSGDSIQFHRESVGRGTLKHLRRGSFSVQSETDLHGMTVPEAKEALAAFIIESRRNGHTCVRVIHGKGLGSGARGPVLKRKVDAWLRRWDDVLAFVSARQIDGGTGAVYVLLKK